MDEAGIAITVRITLPLGEAARSATDEVLRFIDDVRDLGAEVQAISPSPSELDRRLGEIREQVEGIEGHEEEKAELMDRDIPFITIEGTRGGAAVAASATNALARMAAAQPRG